jgi:hypothetical protein
MERLIDRFARESGFKVLAMSRLSEIEYSVVLYLINCAVSNLGEVITTDAELSSLIGYPEKDVRQAMDHLANRQLIVVNYGTPHSNPDKDSVRLKLQFDLSKWRLDFQTDVTAKDAVVFPFRRSGQMHLQVVPGREKKKDTKSPTWERVTRAFLSDRNPDNEDLNEIEHAAKILVETHPVDQLLLYIRHFKSRIPTLSLLASSWQHFQELYEEETQKVDLLGARQKHIELDDRLRQAAKNFLSESAAADLSEEERTVIEILQKHRHPRRQLFWAFQTRSRYPKLAKFFEEHSGLMLGITSTGRLVNRPPE